MNTTTFEAKKVRKACCDWQNDRAEDFGTNVKLVRAAHFDALTVMHRQGSTVKMVISATVYALISSYINLG